MVHDAASPLSDLLVELIRSAPVLYPCDGVAGCERVRVSSCGDKARPNGRPTTVVVVTYSQVPHSTPTSDGADGRDGASSMVAVRGNHPRKNENQHATNQDAEGCGHNASPARRKNTEHSPGGHRSRGWLAGAQLPPSPPMVSPRSQCTRATGTTAMIEVFIESSNQAAGRTPQARKPTFHRAPMSGTDQAEAMYEEPQEAGRTGTHEVLME